MNPRVVKLLQDAFGHAKAIGCTDATLGLLAAGITADASGIIEGDPDEVAARILDLLASHQAWDRFPAAAPA